MLGLFLLVLVVMFTWLCVRSVRAGWGRLLGWLLCLVLGLCLLTAVDAPPPPWNEILGNSFVVAMVSLPAWWWYLGLTRARRHRGKGD